MTHFIRKTFLTALFLICLIVTQAQLKYVPYRINNSWGMANVKGKIILQPEYDKPFTFYKGLATVQKDNRWGVIDSLGEVIIPCIYPDRVDWIFVYDKNNLLIEQRNSKEDMIIAILKAKNHKFGILDGETGVLLIDTIYQFIRPEYIDGYFSVKNNDGKEDGIFDVIAKRWLFPMQKNVYYRIYQRMDDKLIYAEEQRNDSIFKYKITPDRKLSKQSEIYEKPVPPPPIPLQEVMVEMSGDTLKGKKENRQQKKELTYSAFDKKVAFSFPKVYMYEGKFGLVFHDWTHGALNKGGNSIRSTVVLDTIPPMYEAFNIHTRNYHAAKLNGRWGVVNNKNKIIIPFIYDTVDLKNTGMQDEFFVVRLNGSYSLINNKNRIIIKHCSNIGYIKEGSYFRYFAGQQDGVFIPAKKKAFPYLFPEGVKLLHQFNINHQNANESMFWIQPGKDPKKTGIVTLKGQQYYKD